jgi:putative spermidine/putrescine transport system permease protein
MRWVILFNFTIIFGLLLLLAISTQWSYPNLLPNIPASAKGTFKLLDRILLKSIYQSLLLSITLASLATIFGFFASRYAVRFSRLALLPFLIAPIILMASLRHFFITIGLNNTWGGVLIGQFFLAYPFAFIFLHPFWSNKWEEMMMTSQELGANLFHTFTKIIGPIARPVLTLCFFHTFLISWFDYGTALIIGAGQVKTLTVLVYQYVQEANIFLAARASVIIGIPAFLLLLINKHYILGKIPFYGS